MHNFYTLLAIDLANERALEAQRRNAARKLVADGGRPNWIRRRRPTPPEASARCSTTPCRPNSTSSLASPRATATDIVPA